MAKKQTSLVSSANVYPEQGYVVLDLDNLLIV